MVHLIAAMTSVGFLVFGMGIIMLTLRNSGTAVLVALMGDTGFTVVHRPARVSRVVRVQPRVMPRAQLLRAAA